VTAACVDGIGQHLGVQVEADRRQVAGLLGAEDVAGAADLEVRQRNLVAGAEVRCAEDGVQPPAGDQGQR